MKISKRYYTTIIAAFLLITVPSLALAQGDSVITDSDVARLRAFIGDADFGGSSSGAATSSGTAIDGVYVVRPGDTLSEIMATHLGDTGINDDVLQRVIVSNNKSAFRRGNPHWLMAGANLRMPTVSDVMEYVVPGQANPRAGRADEWVRYP
ncbi:MAG: hypothetical protein VW202_13220 [Halieaceae bacterium]